MLPLTVSSAVLLPTALLYLQAVNGGNEAMLRLLPVLYADAVAVEVAKAPEPHAIQQIAEAFSQRPSVVSVAVIAEPRSAKYRFLKTRRFLGHGVRSGLGHREKEPHSEAGDRNKEPPRIRAVFMNARRVISILSTP